MYVDRDCMKVYVIVCLTMTVIKFVIVCATACVTVYVFV